MEELAVLLVLVLVVLGLCLAFGRLSPRCRALACGSAPGGRRAPVCGGAGEPPPFPYLRGDLPPRALMYRALKSAEPEVVAAPEYPGGVVRRTWPRDMRAADALSSHYSEAVRARCAFGRHPSPEAAWADPALRARAERTAARLERQGLTRVAALREGLYEVARWCNFYNPTFCLWLYRDLARRLKRRPEEVRILDPSAGWGDRLLAACAFGAAAYHGYDPNDALQPAYREIIADFAPAAARTAGDFWVKAEPFEAAAVEAADYDIVHTSPPFFDLEKYPGAGGATARALKQYKRWVRRFYQSYLKNAWGAVKPGGFLVLYVDDNYRTLVQDTKKILSRIGAQLSETRYGFQQMLDWPELGLEKDGPIRPAFVWRKDE